MTAPALALAAAPTRAALIDELRRLRALPPEAWPASTPAHSRATSPHAGAIPGGARATPGHARTTPAHARERVAVIGPRESIGQRLDAALERLPSIDRPRFVSRPQGIFFTADADPGRVAFLFSGQGAEHIGMLRGLHARVPAVRRWFDALDAAAANAGLPPPTEVIYPSSRLVADRRQALHALEAGAQLGTVAGLALHELVGRLGVRADAHVGHSYGEHAAVIASGRVPLDRESLCRSFVALGHQGRTLRPAQPERLVAVSAPIATVSALLAEHRGALHLAMDNCPNQIVIGGLADMVDAVPAKLAASGTVSFTLPFPRAFHTPLFRDWADLFRGYYWSLPLVADGVTVYSCHSEMPLPADPGQCREVMAAQWTETVRFRTTIERLHDEGFRTFVEIGPDRRLTPFVEDTLRGRPHVATSVAAAGRDEIEHLHVMTAELFTAGVSVDTAGLGRLFDEPPSMAAYAADVHRRLLQLGREALARGASTASATAFAAGGSAERGSVACGSTARGAAEGSAPVQGGLLGVVHAGPQTVAARRRFTRAGDPFVDDHALGRPSAAHPDGGYPLPVLPFTLSLAVAAEAALPLIGRDDLDVTAVRASRWLALDHGALDLEVSADRMTGGVRVRLREADSAIAGPAFEAIVGRRVEEAAGRRTDATVLQRAAAQPASSTAAVLRAPERWTAERFYADYAFHGPSFRVVREVTAVGPRDAVADLVITGGAGLDPGRLVVDPAMLDGAGQLVAFWLLEQRGWPPTFGIFPFALDRLSIRARPQPPGSRVLARATIEEADDLVRAQVRFSTESDETIATLDGFSLRRVQFPDALARRIFGGDAQAVPGADAIELLTSSFRIWERALAHLALPSSMLARWASLDGRADDRARWLLDALAGPASCATMLPPP